MMFLDCPAYLDQDGIIRCGLPAEVRCRSHVLHRRAAGQRHDQTPAGHWFNGTSSGLCVHGCGDYGGVAFCAGGFSSGGPWRVSRGAPSSCALRVSPAHRSYLSAVQPQRRTSRCQVSGWLIVHNRSVAVAASVPGARDPRASRRPATPARTVRNSASIRSHNSARVGSATAASRTMRSTSPARSLVTRDWRAAARTSRCGSSAAAGGTTASR